MVKKYLALNPDGFFLVIENEYNSEDTEELCMELNIKNLHQLQNLYFSLTGEELEINL